MQDLPQAPRSRVVAARGARWRVIGREAFDGCALVTLRGCDPDNAGDTARLLQPFDRLAPLAPRTRPRRTGRRALASHVAAALAAAHPWRGCGTAVAAAIDLLPWQLAPALAVLGGATRVLLADAVGLGKTVQAALILAELAARGLVARALILTPAALRAQWAGELAARFRIDATILDQEALAHDAGRLPADVSPWSVPAIVISSIDLVKRPEVRPAVEREAFDLLIVDEAHHATPESDRGALVARLAARTPWVVLASATPHSGDERAFRFLQDLGATAADRLVVFRRRAPRRVRPIRTRIVTLAPSPPERALLDEIARYAAAIWRARGAASPAARLVAMVLARRASSSADAVRASLIRRRALLAGIGDADPERQSILPWDELEMGGDAVEADGVLGTPGLIDAHEERAWLDRLIALAEDAAHLASKPAWIRRFAARTGEPVIVFSEYRDTVEALRARLAADETVAVVHGGLSPAVRQAAVSAFVDGPADLLLATDAAGEGLNLQARCRAVITVELPWSPLRLEQRIGRVDRLGQTRRVHALHLVHADSIERTVLTHLQRRVAPPADGEALAEGDAVDLRVAAHVLGGSPPAAAVAAPPDAEMPEAAAEAGRLATLRRMLDARPRHRGGPRFTASRPAAGGAGIVRCVLQAGLRDRDGQPLAARLVALRAALQRVPAAPRARDAALRQILAALAGSAAAVDEAAVHGNADRQAWQAFAAAVHARVRRLLDREARSGELVQPDLFPDRRPQPGAGTGGPHDGRRRARLVQLANRVDPARALLVDGPHLVGAWFEPRR